MQPHLDETAFDWIRCGLDERSDTGTPWAGYFVTRLMPPLFEAYAKILHRVDANYEYIDNPLSPAEIALLKIPRCEKLRSLIEARRANHQGTRVRWKEVADLLDIPFAPAICHEWYRKKLEETCWPRHLRGPDDGNLRPEERESLVEILRPFCVRGECFFRFSQVLSYRPDGDKPLLFRGALDEIGELPSDKFYRVGPEYWWPSDRSWCVCSEFDLMYTFVGGPKELVSTLLANEVLECIEVTSQTRIDYHAPMPGS
jgi:hypothetical protein